MSKTLVRFVFTLPIDVEDRVDKTPSPADLLTAAQKKNCSHQTTGLPTLSTNLEHSTWIKLCSQTALDRRGVWNHKKIVSYGELL